jgi:hypothetical protein
MKSSSWVCWIILFQSFILSYGVEYLVPSSKNQKYQKIFFPKDSWDDFPSELFSYKIFVAPVTSFQTINDAIDLCQGLEEVSLTSCEKYFCNSESEPFHFKQSKNTSLLFSSRASHSIMHTKIERYCTICNQSFDQNFTFSQCVTNQSLGELCYFNACPGGSVCVPMNFFEFTPSRLFETPFPICYDFVDNTFYAHPDFTHKVLYWCYYRWIPLIALIFQIIVFILITITILLPECFWLIFVVTCSRFKPTCKQFFHMVISLRNASWFILFIEILVNLFCLFFDLWGFTIFRLSSLAIYPSGATSIMCYMLIVILWQYILDQSTRNFSKTPKYSWKIMYSKFD